MKATHSKLPRRTGTFVPVNLAQVGWSVANVVRRFQVVSAVVRAMSMVAVWAMSYEATEMACNFLRPMTNSVYVAEGQAISGASVYEGASCPTVMSAGCVGHLLEGTTYYSLLVGSSPGLVFLARGSAVAMLGASFPWLPLVEVRYALPIARGCS